MAAHTEAEIIAIERDCDRRGLELVRGPTFTLKHAGGDEIWSGASLENIKGYLAAHPYNSGSCNNPYNGPDHMPGLTKRALQDKAKYRGYWMTGDGGGKFSLADRADHDKFALRYASPAEVLAFLETSPVLPPGAPRRVS